MRRSGSAAYQAKLARYTRRQQSALQPTPAPPRPPPRPPRADVRRQAMALLRLRVEAWVGLDATGWSQLPARDRRRIAAALREYYAELAEPRSPHAGMYGRFADVFHALPWLDWPRVEGELEE